MSTKTNEDLRLLEAISSMLKTQLDNKSSHSNNVKILYWTQTRSVSRPKVQSDGGKRRAWQTYNCHINIRNTKIPISP